MTTASKSKNKPTGDMKLEVIVIPVSDVDRAKEFYASLGWRLDADFAADGYRVIQFTPSGSGASVIFGSNVTAAAPGSAQGLYLIVSDIEAARAQLLSCVDLEHLGDLVEFFISLHVQMVDRYTLFQSPRLSKQWRYRSGVSENRNRASYGGSQWS